MNRDADNVVHLEPAGSKPPRKPVANPLSLRQELNKNALTKGLLAFDEFAHCIMLTRPIPRPDLQAPKQFERRPWQDVDDTALAEHLNSRGFIKVSRNLVREVIELEARSHPYHPVRDYLEALQWDGQPRLSRFLIDYCGVVIAGETEHGRRDALRYVEAVTRCLFISAVARIMEPGCKVDHTPILEGAQGTLKSSLLRALAVRNEWFSDSLPHNLASRDARQHLSGVWIVEMAEIAQFRHSEAEAVKDFISCQIDRFRPPYGRADISIPRQCIFIGTTNSDIYLRDVTGNRRFWPIRITDIRLVEARAIVDQLWAEAYAAYSSGEKWWLNRHVEEMAVVEQEGRLEHDPWHDSIATFVEQRTGGSWFTTADVLEHLKVPIERRERSHEMRVGAVLSLLRCERKKRWISKAGKSRWTYRAPEGSEGPSP